MKKVLLICILVLFSCSTSSIIGSGKEEIDIREFGEFNEIEFECSGILNLYYAEKCSIEIKTDDNIMPLIDIVNENKVLSLKIDENVRPKVGLVFNIYLNNLKNINLLGSGDIFIKESFEGDEFLIKLLGSGDIFTEKEIKYKKVSILITGSGNVKVSGECETETIDIVGSGDVEAKDLKFKTGTVNITGSGNTIVNSSNEVMAEITGSGDIYQYGRGRVNADISGSGKVLYK